MSYRNSTGAAVWTAAVVIAAAGAATGPALGGIGKSAGQFGSAAGAFVELKISRTAEHGEDTPTTWVRAAGAWIEMDKAATPATTLNVASDGLKTGGASAMDDSQPAQGPTHGGVLDGVAVSRLDISKPLATVSDALIAFGSRHAAGSSLAELALGTAMLAEISGVSPAEQNAFADVGAPRFAALGNVALAAKAGAERVVWGRSTSLLVYAPRAGAGTGTVAVADDSRPGHGGDGGITPAGTGVNPPRRLFDFVVDHIGDGMIIAGVTDTGGVSSSAYEGARPIDGGIDPTADVPGPGAVAVLGLGGLAGLRRRRR